MAVTENPYWYVSPARTAWQEGFEAGRASRDAYYAELHGNLVDEATELRAQLAEKEAECERLRAAQLSKALLLVRTEIPLNKPAQQLADWLEEEFGLERTAPADVDYSAPASKGEGDAD